MTDDASRQAQRDLLGAVGRADMRAIPETRRNRARIRVGGGLPLDIAPRHELERLAEFGGLRQRLEAGVANALCGRFDGHVVLPSMPR